MVTCALHLPVGRNSVTPLYKLLFPIALTAESSSLIPTALVGIIQKDYRMCCPGPFKSSQCRAYHKMVLNYIAIHRVFRLTLAATNPRRQQQKLSVLI